MKQIFFWIKVFCLFQLCTWAQATDWTVPYYELQQPKTLQLSVRLNGDQPGSDWRAKVENISAVSGEIHYDANIFCSPRIEPGPNWPNRQATGMEIEPGVYRFTIYTNPIEKIWYGFDLAYISLSYEVKDIQDATPPGGIIEISFENEIAVAHKLNSRVTRSYLEPVSFVPFQFDQETLIKAEVLNWSLYN